ncbi:MAG TPA: BMP family ABC transporter substrate-binding protein [Firmicutes bacterium]|jgi:basic membrane protein A|nr:BMP family ABC transporter substrate-binding protein [Bacillota bacterium]
MDMGKARKIVLVLTVLMLLAGMVRLSGHSMAAEDKFKVGFIYIGPVGDAGWTLAHDEGRRFMEKQLPWAEGTFIESVAETAEAERMMTQLARQGCKIIFATSFGYMDYVQNVAKNFPNVKFEHCSGFKRAANVSTYFGRMYEPRFLSGMVAGMMTKSNILGYVAAFPIPEVVRGINAFARGVRFVNPSAKVQVVWTNTWYDPATEKEAAKAALDAGADVIAQHQDTPAPMQAAEERGRYGVSYNSPMSHFAPNAVLTGPVWNWGPYYVNRVKAAREGTWKSEDYWGGIVDGVVGLAPYGSMVSDKIKKAVADKQAEIVAAKFHPFAGPIKDNFGKVRVPAGKTMTDAEMLSFDWFVEGVVGTLPK